MIGGSSKKFLMSSRMMVMPTTRPSAPRTPRVPTYVRAGHLEDGAPHIGGSPEAHRGVAAARADDPGDDAHDLCHCSVAVALRRHDHRNRLFPRYGRERVETILKTCWALDTLESAGTLTKLLDVAN